MMLEKPIFRMMDVYHGQSKPCRNLIERHRLGCSEHDSCISSHNHDDYPTMYCSKGSLVSIFACSFDSAMPGIRCGIIDGPSGEDSCDVPLDDVVDLKRAL